METKPDREPKRSPTYAELHAPIHYEHPHPARTAEEWLKLDREELEMELQVGAVVGEV